MELGHSCFIVATHETSFTFRAATKVTLQHHQILRRPRKATLQTPKYDRFFLENAWNVIYSAGPIRAWSVHLPVSPQPARKLRLLFALTRRTLYWRLQYFTLRLSFQISPSLAPATQSDSPTSIYFHCHERKQCATWMQLHQTLRLPRKVTVEQLNCAKSCACHELSMCNLNATSSKIARAMKSDSWTAPSTAPATKTRCTTWAQLHQVLRLPRKMYYSLTLVFFYSTFDNSFTLNYSFSLLLFYSTILLHYDSFALVFFCSTYYSLTLFVSYSSSLLLYYVFTLLFFDSTILLLYYYCRSCIGSFSTKFPFDYNFYLILFTHHIYKTSLYLYFFETTKSSTLSIPFSTWHCRCNTDMFSCFPDHGIEYKGKQRMEKLLRWAFVDCHAIGHSLPSLESGF